MQVDPKEVLNQYIAHLKKKQEERSLKLAIQNSQVAAKAKWEGA